MTTTYKPRADSLAGRVIDFLARNPDEELDIEAIAAKFDVSRNGIHTHMAQAVTAGLVKRVQQPDGSYGYKAGPNLAADAAPGAKAPPITSRVDPAAVPIDTHVPVPTGRSMPVDWGALLRRLQPTHSAELPIKTRPSLAKAIKEAKAAQLGDFTIRTDKTAGTLRVWRTA